MRLPFGKRIIKRCPKGHEIELVARACPRCGDRASLASVRDIGDETIVESPRSPTETSRSGREEVARATIVRVEMISGPRAGERMAFREGRTKIGKSPTADGGVLLLVVADSYLSRDHMFIDVGSRGVVLTDLRSTNGTFVNDVRVETAQLGVGDEVSAGETRFRVLSVETA